MPQIERRQECADIDADIEDRIGAVAARIARRIEPADLRGNVRLEAAVAEDEEQQREQKELLDRHHEMADRHQARADDDGAALAEHAVGQQAAEDRREIDQPGIEAPDLRRQRLHVERTEHGFQRALQRVEPAHIAGVLRQQQVLGHVQHEQRAHPVIREALPHLGGEQERQPARMAEQVAVRNVIGYRLNTIDQDGSLTYLSPRAGDQRPPDAVVDNKTPMRSIGYANEGEGASPRV